MKHTLKKIESLKSKKYFDALFEAGDAVKSYPIRAIFVPLDSSYFANDTVPAHTQVAFSVPKKRFKHAVDRNRIKRQMREGYRLNKFILEDAYAIIFIYLSNKELSSDSVHQTMVSILNKIQKHSTLKEG